MNQNFDYYFHGKHVYSTKWNVNNKMIMIETFLCELPSNLSCKTLVFAKLWTRIEFFLLPFKTYPTYIILKIFHHIDVVCG
jgi:hypothetical protein